MGRNLRILFAVVLLILLAFSALAPSQAQLLQPDLVPQEPLLSPASKVDQRVIVRASATVSNSGTAPAGEFVVELSWRRVDQEELCGFERTSFPSLEVGDQVPPVQVRATIDTADLTPGEYEVAVRVDPDDRVAELDETNNRKSTQLKINPPKPELHPISLSFDPTSPAEQGQTVRVIAEIENTGESTAGEFQVTFKRCKGEISDCLEIPDDEWDLFGSALVPGLKRNEHLLLEKVLDTAGLALGSPNNDSISPYTIKVTVDEPDQVKEQDPDNNEIIGALGIKPSKLNLPELQPVSIIFNRDLPLEWDRDITATVTIINSGGGTAHASRDKPIIVRFSYRQLGAKDWEGSVEDNIEEDLGIEEGNNSTTAKATFTFARPGSYELEVWVDPPDNIGEKSAGKIEEQNEENNRIIVGLSVQGSELHPQSIELGAAPIHQGDTITVTSQIENTGKKTAERFTVAFFIDNLRFNTFYYQGEGLGENDVVKVQGTLDTTDLPPKNYTLRIFVDPDNKIPELDEANNVISTPLVILPPEPRRVELHPTGLVLEPPSPVRGGRTMSVAATIWNTGNIDAEHFQVELAYTQKAGTSSQDGQSWTPFAVQEIPGLPRGGKNVIEGQLNTAGLTVGVIYQIRVLVDPQDEVKELDEGNNALIVALSLVTPAVQAKGANLKLLDLTLSPPSPVAQGTQIQVCAEIANTGQGAAGEFLAEFLDRQDQAGPFSSFASKSISGLEVGRSITICEMFNTAGLPLRSYEIKVVVDSGNWVPELDETDNELTQTLIISQAVPRPDLYPAGLSFNPPSPVAAGVQVQVCVKVTNLGTVAAGPFAISYAYRLDSYVQFATAQTPGLGGGRQVELCRTLDTSGFVTGTYEIKVVVDPDNRVAEGNEMNNELAGYLTIGLPPTPTAQLALSTGGAVRLLGLDEETGTVYIASEDGKLYALERGGGAKSGFPFDAAGLIRALTLDVGASRAAYLGTATLTNDTGTSVGKLYAVALDSGREICQAALDSEISALGVDKFGNVYLGTATKLTSLTAACEPRWEFATVGAVRALAVDDPHDVIYAITSTRKAGTSGGLLYALGREGSPGWQLDLGSPLSALTLGQAIYVGTEDGKVQARGFADGRLIWEFPAEVAITAIVIDVERHDPIYVTSADGKLYSLDLEGNLRWAFSTGGSLYSEPAIDGRTGAIFFGSDEGKFYALDPDGTKIFAATVNSPIRSNPVIDVVVEREGTGIQLVRTIYFGAEDQNVYLIKTRLQEGN